jgi:hypothetical protein
MSKPTSLRQMQILIVGLAALLYCGFVFQCRHQRARSESIRHGCYSAHQVLALAQRLNPLVTPEGGMYFFAAQYQQTASSKSMLAHTWDVVCTDEGGNFRAYFVWSAETGRLLKVTCPVAASRAEYPSSLTAREAAEWGTYWLQTLDMASSSFHWHLTAPPRPWRQLWSMEFRANEQQVSVIVDGSNNHLVSVCLR